ncbi:hypothetical protein [Flavobacterium sp.]|uniref:hypothetical protein n=1 Tax=Flavobacterium sp. TaxID=239 RepID=UPI0039E3AF48
MAHPLKQLVLDMRHHLYHTGLPLEPAFADELQAHPKPTIIAAIFRVSQSSVAQDLVVRLPHLMQTTNYTDLLQAFEMIKDDDLSVYHYRDFVASIFGIDVAQMTQNQMRSNAKPSDWSQEYLSDRQIDQQELINRMKEQGAPMMA